MSKSPDRRLIAPILTPEEFVQGFAPPTWLPREYDEPQLDVTCILRPY
jgi:hypothetical protein